jgi:hypothetical protein
MVGNNYVRERHVFINLRHCYRNSVTEERNREVEHVLLAMVSIQDLDSCRFVQLPTGSELETLITTSWK